MNKGRESSGEQAQVWDGVGLVYFLSNHIYHLVGANWYQVEDGKMLWEATDRHYAIQDQ